MNDELERVDQIIHTKKSYEEALTGAGISKESIEKVIRASKPSVRLVERAVEKESEIPVGASKLGGDPDLPKGFSWPTNGDVPLGFIAQIECAEAAKKDSMGLLPGTGYLWFFYEAKEQVWGYDPKHKGNWKVEYHDVPRDSLIRVPLPDGMPEESQFSPCAISFQEDLTIPYAWGPDWKGMGISEKEGDRLLDYEADAPINLSHRMLGHPNAIQGDMQLECQLVSNGLYCGDETGYKDPRAKELEKGAHAWRLLLQIDTSEGMSTLWGDEGRLFFWIKEEDLKAKRFENVWTVLQCY